MKIKKKMGGGAAETSFRSLYRHSWQKVCLCSAQRERNAVDELVFKIRLDGALSKMSLPMAGLLELDDF